jgi:hypothetical protein
VGIALDALAIDKGFRAGAATLVRNHNGGWHQIIFLGNRLDNASELVGASAGAGGRNELNRLLGLPGSLSGARGKARDDPSRNGQFPG